MCEEDVNGWPIRSKTKAVADGASIDAALIREGLGRAIMVDLSLYK